MNYNNQICVLNDNVKYDIDTMHYKYISVEYLRNEKLKRFILNNSTIYNVQAVQIVVNDIILNLKTKTNFDQPFYIDGEIYNNGYQYLSETNEKYRKLTDILCAVSNGDILILHNANKRYFEFINNNFYYLMDNNLLR